ncbi:DUF4278 domain-containing protein [Scytonema sp. PCC 10023]|uniref:DUF4278 domain-containing protein n=1 Tax=Scytonema sp. PCC 10023 TaxID=1680591 RepID=UPI0039C60AD9
MKLYYRGLSYELDSSHAANKKTEKPFQSVRPIGSPYNLIYRGVTYHVNPNVNLDEVSAPLVTNKLVYRGIVYTVNKTTVGDICVGSQPISI